MQHQRTIGVYSETETKSSVTVGETTGEPCLRMCRSTNQHVVFILTHTFQNVPELTLSLVNRRLGFTREQPMERKDNYRL